jgi:hypothetical protein
MKFVAYARPSSGPSGDLLPVGEGDVSIASPSGRRCREAAGEGRALALLVIVGLLATAAFAQEPPVAPPPPKPPESALVKAAHAAKAKKEASKKKPITNADLKKAKSKLLTFEPSTTATDTPVSTPTPASTTAAATDTKGPYAKEDERYRVRKEAEARVSAAAAKVSDLEKELDRVEQSYYNTNDPTERDTVIAKRFAQTKKQLEDARKELADARDALAALK